MRTAGDLDEKMMKIDEKGALEIFARPKSEIFRSVLLTRLASKMFSGFKSLPETPRSPSTPVCGLKHGALP